MYLIFKLDKFTWLIYAKYITKWALAVFYYRSLIFLYDKYLLHLLNKVCYIRNNRKHLLQAKQFNASYILMWFNTLDQKCNLEV